MIIFKNKLPPFFLFILIFNLSFCFLSYADKGIFNPKINPDEIFTTAIPAVITVTAEIGDIPMNDVEVSSYQVSENGEKLNYLCKMDIDIENGEFSGQFTLNQDTESIFYFKIFANYNSQKMLESNILKINIYEPLEEGLIVELQKNLKKLNDKFDEYLKSHNLLTARKMVLEDAKNTPNITSAFLDGRNLSLEYKNKVNGVVFLDDPNGESVDDE